MDNYIKINIQLKKILMERNISQLELAQWTGIRPNAISNLCRNYVDRLNIDHLERICEELEINDISQLISIKVRQDEQKV